MRARHQHERRRHQLILGMAAPMMLRFVNKVMCDVATVLSAGPRDDTGAGEKFRSGASSSLRRCKVAMCHMEIGYVFR